MNRIRIRLSIIKKRIGSDPQEEEKRKWIRPSRKSGLDPTPEKKKERNQIQPSSKPGSNPTLEKKKAGYIADRQAKPDPIRASKKKPDTSLIVQKNGIRIQAKKIHQTSIHV